MGRHGEVELAVVQHLGPQGAGNEIADRLDEHAIFVARHRVRSRCSVDRRPGPACASAAGAHSATLPSGYRLPNRQPSSLADVLHAAFPATPPVAIAFCLALVEFREIDMMTTEISSGATGEHGDDHVSAAIRAVGALRACRAAGIGAQVATNVPDRCAVRKPVRIERIKVHSPAIEAISRANSADRDVLVLLPPSYAATQAAAIRWSMPCTAIRSAPSNGSRKSMCRRRIEGAFAKGAREMIVVLPDSKTVPQRLDVFELGDDRRFRDLHRARSGRLHRRALPHDRTAREPRPGRPFDGRLRRQPHRHEACRRVRRLYIMSPCCLSARDPASFTAERQRAAGGGQDARGGGEAAIRPARPAGDRRGLVAQSRKPAALSRPAGRRTAGQPDVLARWAANAPLAFVDQYVGNLRRYRAIAIDVGDQDGLRLDARSCTRCWTTTASPTASKSILARTPAMSPVASRIT